jgi:hypothetical protein
MGTDRSRQRDAAAESEQAANQEVSERGGVLSNMDTADKDYLDAYTRNMEGYLGRSRQSGSDYLSAIAENRRQAQDQARSAKMTYSNDIQPRLKSSMEDAQREAGYAMSLKDAADPNNAVHRAVRGMYDQQAQGVQKQGVADYGVLSALGAQATQNVMGSGGPMTGAQLQLTQAVNQRQAGEAYARAQQRMDALKQQGIDRGFEESDRQYQRGEGARDRYRQSIGDYEGGMDRDIARQGRFRDEDMGYAGQAMGVQRGLSREDFEGRTSVDALKKGNAYGSSNRQLSQIDARYGNQQAAIANRIAEANAENAAKSGMIGAVMQGGATAAGAYYGGAGGAAAGGTAARSLGGYQSPPPSQAQNAYYGAQNGNMIGGSVAQGMSGYGQAPQQQGFQQRRRTYEFA